MERGKSCCSSVLCSCFIYPPASLLLGAAAASYCIHFRTITACCCSLLPSRMDVLDGRLSLHLHICASVTREHGRGKMTIRDRERDLPPFFIKLHHKGTDSIFILHATFTKDSLDWRTWIFYLQYNSIYIFTHIHWCLYPTFLCNINTDGTPKSNTLNKIL